MRWALLLLVACGKSDDSAERPDPTSPCTDSGCTGTGLPTSTTSAVPRPDFTEPPEAEDTDPAADVVAFELTAATHSFEVDGELIDGYAYNQTVPGPTLRATVGDTVRVTLHNQLADPTTIHWHGLEVPWEMDGVTWMQEPVAAGSTKVYEFVVEQAGTFWYHPHFDTAHQVDHGLYGMLVVSDPAEPVVDEAVWVFDTWGESAFGEDHPHLPDPTGRVWTLNGLVQPAWRLPTSSVRRVRVLNVSNAGYLHLADVLQIAGDQGLLPAPVQQDVVLGPGDRVELQLDVDATTPVETLPWSPAGGPAWGDPIVLLDLVAEGSTGAPGSVNWPTSDGTPTPDPGHTDVRWALQGDPTGGWLMNGEQFPDVTIPEAALDQPLVIEVRNLSAGEHPFHLHGMHFEVLSVDGQPPAYKQVEDTVNVRIGQVVRLLTVPGEPGDWMAHCHILPHAEEGMMTVLRVP